MWDRKTVILIIGPVTIYSKQMFSYSRVHILLDTAGEERTNSSVMYSYGPPHMAEQKQDDQLEHTYSSYVRIRDVALKTCQKRWSGDREKWRERVRDIRASGTTWWWWWWWYIYIYIYEHTQIYTHMYIYIYIYEHIFIDIHIYWQKFILIYLWISDHIYRYIIIIIMWRCQHGYPRPSLVTPPYRPSLLAGPQGYIPYLLIAAVCRFVLVALPLLGHVKGSTRVHPLWARPYFSSSVLNVWLVSLG